MATTVQYYQTITTIFSPNDKDIMPPTMKTKQLIINFNNDDNPLQRHVERSET